MRVKLTIDRDTWATGRESVRTRLRIEFADRVKLVGDTILVEEGYEETEVVKILNSEGVTYTRSKY